MDIVLPLLEGDLERYLRLQRPTFERFYADLGTTWIIARPSDLVRIGRATSRLRGVRVVDERDLVPETGRARMMLLSRRPGGWHIQQLVKLAAVAWSDAQFSLVLDADVVAVGPVADVDLFVGDRALRPKDPPHRYYPKWSTQAAVVLGMEPIDYSASLTPSILSRDAVRLLAEHVARSVRPRGRARAAALTPGLSRLVTSWRGRLISALPWTEYQLYDTFLVGTGNFERFHWSSETDSPRLYGPSVWFPEQFENWFPTPIAGAGTHFFAVVQSNCRISVEAVEERLRETGLLGEHIA